MPAMAKTKQQLTFLRLAREKQNYFVMGGVSLVALVAESNCA